MCFHERMCKTAKSAYLTEIAVLPDIEMTHYCMPVCVHLICEHTGVCVNHLLSYPTHHIGIDQSII